MNSIARTVIFPLQDVMGLDNQTRMNDRSSILDANWQWRFGESGIFNKLEIEKHKLLTFIKEQNHLPMNWNDVVTKAWKKDATKDGKEVSSGKVVIRGLIKKLIIGNTQEVYYCNLKIKIYKLAQNNIVIQHI